MAESLTVTVEKNPFMDGSMGGSFAVILDWVSAAGGTVSKNIASTYTAQKPFGEYFNVSKILGTLVSVETIPGADGDLTTDLPSANYNIAIKDKYGLDVTGGHLATRSGTVAEKIVAEDTIIIDSELKLVIDSAGDSNQGRIVMEFEEIAGNIRG